MISPIVFHSQDNKQINFKSKKTLYTDFDGTYFPFGREDVNSENKNDFAKMYEPFDRFQKQSDGDCSIVVTSGRSKNNFLHTVARIVSEKLPFSRPKGLISSNGANEFVDTDSGLKSVYPLDDSSIEGALDSLSGFIKKQNPDIELFETKINGTKANYQDFSSEIILDSMSPEKRKKYISIARDGKYNAELVVSKRNDLQEINNQIHEYISKNNLPYSVECYENAKYTTGTEYNDDKKINVPANVIYLKYSKEIKQPDKFDLIKNKAEKIIKNNSNDIMIVAGDAYNDEKMLNPLNYLGLVYDGKPDLNNEKCISALNKLPVRFIICGQNSELDNLRKTANELNKKGVNIIQCAPNPKEDYINLVQHYTQQATLSEISGLLGKEGKDDYEREVSGKKLSEELNKLYDLPQEAKREFIKQYCNITGFPDMKLTSKRINREVKKALNEAQGKTDSKVLLAGCNPTCSISNGHALPGSDLDTLFICLRNEDDKWKFLDEFKKSMNPLLVGGTWNRTNDMPDIVSIGEIENSLNLANKIFKDNKLDKDKKNTDLYKKNLDEMIGDWKQAGKYNLDINKYVPNNEKTPLLRAGLLMEILRDGNVFINQLDENQEKEFKNSTTYKYSNMQQMRSYKNAPLKQKHKNREKMLSEFYNLSTDDKMDMIVNVIRIFNKNNKKEVNNDKYGCLYLDSGCGNMEDLIQPLLSK